MAEEENEQENVPEQAEAAEPEDDSDDIPAAERLRGSQVINNFYGRVEASNARFGVQISTSTRRATGPISQTEIDQEYVEPACFQESCRLLEENNLVVPVGPEGIGKRTGAIALLSRVLPPGSPLFALAPSIDFAELRIKPGHGYLIADRLDSGAASVQQRFELDRLREELSRNGSYLVITMTTGGALRSLAVEWQPPDPHELFDRHTTTVDDPDYALVRKRIGDLLLPREIIAVARAARAGCRAALDALDESAVKQVREWFDATPTLRDVLSAAATVFVYGVPARTFEVLLDRLLVLGGWGPEPVTGESLEKDLVQRRVQWARDNGLITLTRDLSAELGDPGRERRVVFRSADHREHVAAELYARYGIEVWAPVRAWANEIAASPVSEVHVQLALGVALLSRETLGEVEESFLAPWSDGTGPERVAAAYVLSWMCIDDTLASVALDIALRWVRDSRTRRRITAAAALGSTLGIRFQVQALTWLWHLAARGGVESRVARQSIALLFCANANNDTDATTLLKFVARGLGTSMRTGRPIPALDTVVDLLGAVQPDTGEPAAVVVLRDQPANLDVLGGLWAEALRSARHRGQAMDALRRCLTALGGDEAAYQLTVRLGEAVRGRLSATEVRLLHRSLAHELNRSDLAKRLVSALLVTLSTDQENPPQ